MINKLGGFCFHFLLNTFGSQLRDYKKNVGADINSKEPIVYGF